MNPPTLNTPLSSKPAGSSHAVPWPTSDERPDPVKTPDTSDKSAEQRPEPEAAVLVMNAGHEGNATPGRVADGRVSGHASDGNGRPWNERMRDTVQRRPFAAMATAFAFGALLVRVTR